MRDSSGVNGYITSLHVELDALVGIVVGSDAVHAFRAAFDSSVALVGVGVEVCGWVVGECAAWNELLRDVDAFGEKVAYRRSNYSAQRNPERCLRSRTRVGRCDILGLGGWSWDSGSLVLSSRSG